MQVISLDSSQFEGCLCDCNNDVPLLHVVLQNVGNLPECTYSGKFKPISLIIAVLHVKTIFYLF